MADVEFMSELVIGVMHGPQGGSAKVVDDYYGNYEDFDEEFPGQRKATRLFRVTLETVKTVLPNIKETRWSNKTDFYTLFVTVASLLQMGTLPRSSESKVRVALGRFADEIATRLREERARVSEPAIDYVRAVEKGANDKRRRADRQAALLDVIGRFFKKKRSALNG